MSDSSSRESEISSTSRSASFTTQLSDSSEGSAEEPTSEEFKRSAEMTDQAAQMLQQHDFQQARALAQAAIRLYTRNVRAYEVLAAALEQLQQTRQALEIRLIVAQLTSQQTREYKDFLALLPQIFSGFGDSRSFLTCVKFVFRYSQSDEAKRRFYRYLEKTYFPQLKSSSQIAIRQYFAKSLGDVAEALQLGNDSTRALIFARAVQQSDALDGQCLQFCKANLAKSFVQRLLNLLYLKHKTQELALLLALKSVGVDDKLVQALGGVVGQYVCENAEAITSRQSEFYALIVTYFEYLVELAPRVAREALQPSVGTCTEMKLLAAQAEFQMHNCREASRLLREIMLQSQTLDILVRARLLSADVLQYLGLEENADKVLLAAIQLQPAKCTVAIQQAAPHNVQRAQLFDFQFFYFAQLSVEEPLWDVRFRVKLGIHLLERKQDVAAELLYLPLLHVVCAQIDDQAYLAVLQQILAAAFRCNYCQKAFCSTSGHCDEMAQTNGIFTYAALAEVRRLLRQAGIQQILYRVVDILAITTYHSEKCRSLRTLAMLYLLKCNQRSQQPISLSADRQAQFAATMVQLARQLNYGRLIYADLRTALSQDVRNRAALFHFVESVVEQNDPPLHQSAYKLLKRYALQRPGSADLRTALLYLAMQKRTRSAHGAEEARLLYEETGQTQFLYARALFLARRCHTKTQLRLQDDLFECCQCLQAFLRAATQVSPHEAARAWYAVATLLLTELGQTSEAERILRLLLAGRPAGAYAGAFAPELDARLRAMCAHQLSLCYMHMGNHRACLLVRARHFTCGAAPVLYAGGSK